MKIILNIIKFIAITILAICIILTGAITIVSSTILDKAYVLKKAEETNFYAGTYELVESNFENYIDQSGLDEVVLEGICTEEKIKQDINLILSNIYEGTNEKIDTTEISQKLNANIDKLGVRTSKNTQAIEQFVEHICEEYTNTLIHTKYEDNINGIYTKVINVVHKIDKIATTLLVIDIIILIVLNLKKISKVFQSIGIALLSTSAFNFVVYNIVMSKVRIDGIKIFNDIFSNSIVTIIKDILKNIVSFGIGTFIIGLIFISIYTSVMINKMRLEGNEK